MNTKDFNEQLQELPGQIMRVRKPLFLLLVIIMYLFLVWKIDVLSNAQPTQKAVASHQTTPTLPEIDSSTVNKIQQLQSDSVSVQALFNQARQNPFSE